MFGRHLIAVGANPQAAWLSGIDPRPIRFTTFVLAGLASAVAAVAQSARLAAADPNAGAGLELQAIAAVVIGGTSLMGGRGSVVTTMLGVLIIAVLGAGLAQMGVQEPTRRLVTGAVIVAAASPTTTAAAVIGPTYSVTDVSNPRTALARLLGLLAGRCTSGTPIRGVASRRATASGLLADS